MLFSVSPQIGTNQIAVCAKAQNKPFYVVAESFKFVRLFPLNQQDVPDKFKVREIQLASWQTKIHLRVCESFSSKHVFIYLDLSTVVNMTQYRVVPCSSPTSTVVLILSLSY